MRSIHQTLPVLATMIVLAACGDDTAATGATTGGDGGGASTVTGTSSTDATTGSSASSTSTTTTSTTTTSTTTTTTSTGEGGGTTTSTGEGGGTTGSSSGTTTSTGGEACSVEEFFLDAACNTCATDGCCMQIEDCDANLGQCLDGLGNIDVDSVYGGPLLTCLFAECAPECVGGVCDTGLSYANATLDACVDGGCCTEFRACYGDGTDPAAIAACNACVENGGGILCDAMLGCFETEGCFAGPICDPGEFACSDGTCLPLGWVCDGITDCPGFEDESSCDGVCDSGISYVFDGTDIPNPPLNACVGNTCCAEFNACSLNGADTQGCIDCFVAGGGARCDAAADCSESGSCFAGICQSGVTFGSDPYMDACLAANCCDEFMACTTNGTNTDACVECFLAEGGMLCDDAIACQAAACTPQ